MDHRKTEIRKEKLTRRKLKASIVLSKIFEIVSFFCLASFSCINHLCNFLCDLFIVHRGHALARHKVRVQVINGNKNATDVTKMLI